MEVQIVRKRVLSILLALLIFVNMSAFTAVASGDIKLYIDKEFVSCDVPPEIVNGRTLVPLRVMFDKFGAEVFWNDSLRQVVVSTKASIIIFNIDSKISYVNGVAFNIDVAPTIINGRTLIPVRFISERMGYDVVWNGTERAVYITSPSSAQKNDTNTQNEQSKEDDKKEDDKTDNSSSAEKTRLENISVTDSNDSCLITVSLSEKITPKEMRLSSPERIVLDFEGVNQVCADKKIDFDNSDIVQVRWAYHEDYTRIVIESSVKLNYSFDYTSESCSILVKKINTDKNLPGNDGSSVSNNEQSNNSDIFIPPVLNANAPIIVLDPGHGGYDAGAVGRNDSDEIVIQEKNANLSIALKVEKRLKADGINVIMTRNTDKALGSTVMEDLITRAEIANRAGADLFISIHNNSSENFDATGTCVLYPGLANSGGYGITSKELAQNIQKLLVKATGLRDRGIIESPEMVVLKRTVMPAVLLECAFVSNAGDRNVLLNESKLEEIADAIYKGIINSLRIMGKVK